MKSVLVLVVLVFLNGCIWSKRVPQTISHYSGWSDQIIDLAEHSWEYAQLSEYVYSDGFDYKFTQRFDEIKVYEVEDESFYSTLFQRKKDGSYVFVFRGTDSLRDFASGNNPINQTQNRLGLEFFDTAKVEYGFERAIVTGHSLGGAIATHISLNRENVKAYYFNSSPVFKRLGKRIKNQRFSIVENGEVLKATRMFARKADQLYTSIGCSSGDPIKQHSMRRLADCITQIAAIRNKEAKSSLDSVGVELIWPSRSKGADR